MLIDKSVSIIIRLSLINYHLNLENRVICFAILYLLISKAITNITIIDSKVENDSNREPADSDRYS